MRAVVQRVSRAAVRVGGVEVGSIGIGFVVLLGVAHGDDDADAALMARKIAGLRVFRDDDDRMNLALADVGGGVLLVSQFTLMADVRKGRRPSFVAAAEPDAADPLVGRVGYHLAELGLPVASGRFGAMMEVDLVNDGPVTILLER